MFLSVDGLRSFSGKRRQKKLCRASKAGSEHELVVELVGQSVS